MNEIDSIKIKIYKIAAVTDRGQRLNKLISNVYQEKNSDIEMLVQEIKSFSDEINKDKLAGDWELIFSNVELFRSSPFFLAIEKALNDESKSNLFFKLHQLQVGSFGLSTIGRIFQKIDFQKNEFISSFDTTIFAITAIPIIGWFKLLPTFGGRVVTIANKLELKGTKLKMILQRTKVQKIEGLNKIPILSNLIMDRWYEVNNVWNKLPWNSKEPSCALEIIFIDDDMRIMKDLYGSLFIYVKP